MNTDGKSSGGSAGGGWCGAWSALRRPSARYSLGGLLIAGIALGVIGWGGFNWALEITNTETFCISCHEMERNVYREFQKTVHNVNASGVRATCPDCHVPRQPPPANFSFVFMTFLSCLGARRPARRRQRGMATGWNLFSTSGSASVCTTWHWPQNQRLRDRRSSAVPSRLT